MKKKIFLCALVFSALTLQSCDSDDDNRTPMNTAVEGAFKSKYPTASVKDWERKSNYYVAEFYINKSEAEAWFDEQGIWYLTETDIRYDELPQAVKTAFESGDYKNWRIDDVDMIERKDMEVVYIIEVEKDKQEYDLYYSAEGLLIKAIVDSDNNGNYLPTELSDKIKEYINTNYPSARIIETDIDKGMYEVDVIDGNIHRELKFNSSGEWVMTETELYNKSNIPQNVINALDASEYASYRVDDMYYIETPQRNYYYFELESGQREVDIIITEQGEIEVAKLS